MGHQSIFALVGQSGTVVSMVLGCLLLFSLLTWAIILNKYAMFKRSARTSKKFLDLFWASRSLDSIFTESKKFQTSPISRLFQSGYTELQKIVEFERFKSERKGKSKADIPENLGEGLDWKYELSGIDNIARSLHRASNAEVARLEKRIPFLATVASTAPFIGLFGTVWGIMNSFQGIGAKGSASLAVVAPGIAEALIATAVGLAAAIPAVMGYNYFLARMKLMRTEMDNFSSDFLNIIKRNFFAD